MVRLFSDDNEEREYFASNRWDDVVGIYVPIKGEDAKFWTGVLNMVTNCVKYAEEERQLEVIQYCQSKIKEYSNGNT